MYLNVKLVELKMGHNSDKNTSRTILYRNTKCCDECKDFSSVDLRQLCQPHFSESVQTSYSKISPKIIIEQTIAKEDLQEPKKGNVYAKYPCTAFRDITKTRISKCEHIKECPYRRKCYQCGDLVVTIRNLLDEMKTIKKPIAIDLCQFCSTSGKCKRCEFLADRYKISETIDDNARQQRFKIWLCKVKQVLYTILERETCSQRVCPQSTATNELKNLLNKLKSPLTIREPNIGYFPSIDSLENITESKDILEQVLNRLECDKKSEDFYKHTPCICKYFHDKKFQEKSIMEEEIESSSEISVSFGIRLKETNVTGQAKNFKDMRGLQNVNEKQKDGKNITKEKKRRSEEGKIPSKDITRASEDAKRHSKELKKLSGDRKRSSKDVKRTSGDTKRSSKDIKRTSGDTKRPSKDAKSLSTEKNKPKSGIKEPLTKVKPNSEEELMLKLIKNAHKRGKENRVKKASSPPVMPKIDELPIPIRKVKKNLESGSESFAECDVEEDGPSKMIKGDKLIHIGPHTGSDTGSMTPLLFKVQAQCPSMPDEPASVTTTTSKTTEKSKKSKDLTEFEEAKGLIRYRLSNKEFIEKGWTLLPTTKIMRRMNIYKMIPANPKYDWFDRHKTQGVVLYDTGENFAEIEENGSGKWYYKSGKLALDYNCSRDTGPGHRYVVYSSGEDKADGRRLPVTVLASFDYLGNGVVYDHYGNERLKYNQSEGIVIDKKIGPQGKWKWHTLNDPPVLQPVFVDNLLRNTSCLDELQLKTEDDASIRRKKEPNLDMLAIELENFVKEKAHKLLQEFKPFQIKMKVVKLNDQFALRVLDQANIYLLFREGHTSVKLNLGMQLISNEIVDTDSAEVSHVATPFDCYPPKSQSIADIQSALENARKIGRAHGKLRI